MFQFTKTSIVAAAISLVATSATYALSVSTPETLSGSADLTRNMTESANVRLFAEQTNVVYTGGITVDYVAASIGDGVSTSGVSNFSSGTALSAGKYDSFLIHFDPIGGGSAQASFTFGQKIVAIILSNGSGNQNPNPSDGLLNLSDGTFGVGITYDTHVGRRSENSDSFILSDGLQTISVDLTTNSNFIDNMRVVTEAAPIPLPATAWLLIAGLAGLGVAKRRSGA